MDQRRSSILIVPAQYLVIVIPEDIGLFLRSMFQQNRIGMMWRSHIVIGHLFKARGDGGADIGTRTVIHCIDRIGPLVPEHKERGQPAIAIAIAVDIAAIHIVAGIAIAIAHRMGMLQGMPMTMAM